MTHPNLISVELLELQSSLAGKHRQDQVFTVPEGYFAGFASTMLLKVRSIENNEELAGLSPLLSGLSRLQPFTVPPGYLEELDPMAGLRDEELSPLLSGLKKKQPFRVPEGYFQQAGLPAETNELDSVSPLLGSLARINPYVVPSGYFESLDPLVVIGKKPAKVISLGSFNWKRSVAAAAVIAAVSFSAFFFYNRNGDQPTATAVAVNSDTVPGSLESTGNAQLYAINTADAAEISKLVKNVPDQEIQEFLNETDNGESDIDDALLN
ncbi:MAG: hypothetical protein ABWZ25_06845 [Chitinophagaceae bacterium]